MLRRAAMALRECSSNDIFMLAHVALEAAIQCETDLLVLLAETKPPPQHVKTPAATVVVHA